MPNIEINNKEISVEQMRSDWAMAIMTRGVIVKLKISKWCAYTGLTSETLGLKFVDSETYNFSKKYIRLGQQRLLPQGVIKELNTVENSAKRLLLEYSFNTVWGHFIPFSAFNEWESKNVLIKKDFMEQARVLGDKYDQIVGMVREEYKNLARDVWARLYPNGGEPTLAFTDDFVNKIIAKIPSRESVVASFSYDVDYFIIPMPSFIEDELAKANQIRIRSELEKQNAELEKETRRRISEEYMGKKCELIDGFLESTVIHMRKYVGEICDGILKSIGKSKSVNCVTISSVNNIKALIKKVKLLNFYDDSEISGLFNQLDVDLEKIKGELDNDAIISKLKKIVEISSSEFVPKNFNPSISVLEP